MLQQTLDRRVSIHVLIVLNLFKDLIISGFIAVARQVITKYQVAFCQQIKDALLVRVKIVNQSDLEVVPDHHFLQSVLQAFLSILLLDVKERPAKINGSRGQCGADHIFGTANTVRHLAGLFAHDLRQGGGHGRAVVPAERGDLVRSY